MPAKTKQPAIPKKAARKPAKSRPKADPAKAAAATPEPKPAPAKQEVKITAAKGRPMLSWVGKRPLRHVTAFPAQHVETFDPAGALAKRKEAGGLLYHGDNKEVLAHLLASGFRGQVNLIYIDPPFDSGADYVRKVSLRGPKGTTKIEGESYALGEQIQYTDIWANDNYLQFMFERFMLLKELLATNGVFVIHLDESRSHYLKLLLDEVFGTESFVNEIVWQRQTAHSDVGQGAKHLGRVHDTLFVYAGGDDYRWNDIFTPYSADYLEKFYRFVDEKTGRRYQLGDLSAPGGSEKGNPYYEFLGVTRYWRYSRQRMEQLHKDGRIVKASEDSVPRLKRFLDEMPGVPLQSIWTDVRPVQSQATEREHYPTQKPESVLERIINLASNPGDLVLDCFLGSGTTAAVAQKLGRRWIGCDINKGAIQTTTKRLQGIIAEQRAAAKQAGQQQDLIADDTPKLAPPAQTAFTVHRVNDYDLAIQHNEAVNLACEHIGITRTRADSFFDGTQGQRLAKVIPFGHPLSPADLEELKRELETRKDEERDVVVVCLGKELSVEGWLADWNRLRKRGDVPNKIEVIELRTDPKYGKFIAHQPAQAKVNITRNGDTLAVEITDFISPSILERLQQQAGLLKPRVDDWRAMVDSVMIDPAYDGKVFNIALADVPERKTDYVQGKYELPAPGGRKAKTTVAVKVTDMLGEEVVVAKTV